MELQAVIDDAQTKAVWDLMLFSYNQGLLDEMTRLARQLMDEDIPIGGMLAKIDQYAQEKGLGSAASILDKLLVPFSKAVAKEEVMEATKVLLVTFRPLIEGIIGLFGGDLNAMAGNVSNLRESLRTLKPVSAEVTPLLMETATPFLAEFLKQKAGRIAANSINSGCAIINGINEADPEAIPRFMADVFARVDRKQLRKSSDAILGSVLAQRPNLLRSFLHTTSLYIKNRLGRKGARP